MDKVIGIIAGKGGVGKSTFAVNLALLLTKRGKKVGVIDADIHGPSIQKMLCEETPPRVEKGKIIPAKGLGISYVSAAFFHSHAAGAVVRAPVANQMIGQFLELVSWPQLDYLLVDFPPGTGDIQITLLQHTLLTGAVAVTTPQEVALLDVRKSIHMIRGLHLPLLGIVENMSYFMTDSKQRCNVFGSGGGRRLAEEFQAPLLGQIPLDPLIAQCSDRGVSFFATSTASCSAFEEIADGLERELTLQQKREAGCLDAFELIWDPDKRE
ncbi:MAG: Mrp/NBP35 family ATP-binding protein [Chlamydiota bacterium]